MYVKSDIRYEIINLNYNDSVEQLWIQIKGRAILALGVIYRPLDKSISSFIANFEETIFRITSVSEIIICVGDVNLHLFEIDRPMCVRFNAVVECAGLKQIISQPARVTQSNASLLDVVIVSESQRITGSGVVDLSN